MSSGKKFPSHKSKHYKTPTFPTFNNTEIKLTPTEYSILRYLILHAGKVITQTQIMREVWGPNFEGETNYLRVYIAQLRKKIELDSSNPQLIITEPGVGYRLILI